MSKLPSVSRIWSATTMLLHAKSPILHSKEKGGEMLKVYHPDSDGNKSYSIKYHGLSGSRDLLLQFEVEFPDKTTVKPLNVEFLWQFLKYSWEFLGLSSPLLVNNDTNATIFGKHKNRLIPWAFEKIKEEIDKEDFSKDEIKIDIKRDEDKEWARSRDPEICENAVDESGIPVKRKDIYDAFYIKKEGIKYFPPKQRMGF